MGELIRKMAILAIVGLMLPSIFPNTNASEMEYNSQSGLDGYIQSTSNQYTTARNGLGSLTADTAANLINVGQWMGSGVTKYNMYRGYLSFDTSGIPDDATVSAAELTVAMLTDASTQDFSVLVYWDDYGAALTTADWTLTCLHNEGTIISTASMGTWNSMSLNAAGISLTGRTQYHLKSDRDVNNIAPLSNEYISLGSGDYAGYEPYLTVTYTNFTYGGTYIGTNQTISIPASNIQEYNETNDIYEYRINSQNSDWVNLSAPENQTFYMIYPDATVADWENTANVSSMAVNMSYSLWFLQPVTRMTTLHISMYAINTFSDAPMQGYPWESFRVFITQGDAIPTYGTCPFPVPTATFSIYDCEIVPEPSYEVERGYYYAVAVLDWYNNILAEQLVAANDDEKFVSIDVPAWELAISNQCDDDAYIEIYDSSNLTVPMTLQCPGHWSRFRYLRESNYTIALTMLSGTSTNTTSWYNATIDQATTYRVNGTGLYELYVLSGGIYYWQQMIAMDLAPSLNISAWNTPYKCDGTRAGEAVNNLLYLDPYQTMWGTIDQSDSDLTTGAKTLWGGHLDSSVMLGTVTVLEDTLFVSGTNSSASLMINASATNIINTTASPGITYNILQDYAAYAGANLTVYSNESGLYCHRIIRFRWVGQFTWNYDSERGYMSCAPNINNTLDYTIWRPQVSIAFYPGIEIDLTSVDVFDVDNSAYLDPSINYDVTSTSVIFEFGNISSGEERNFIVSCWVQNSTDWDNTVYGQPSIRLDSPEWMEYQPGTSMWYDAGSWSNNYPATYQGDVYIILELDKTVDSGSIVVMDGNTNEEIPDTDWYVNGNTVVVKAAAFSPGIETGDKITLGVYWQYTTDTSMEDILGPVWNVAGVPLPLSAISIIVGLVLVIWGALAAKQGGQGKMSEDLITVGSVMVILTLVAVILLVLVAKAQGG